jgi:hypothetical protein
MYVNIVENENLSSLILKVRNSENLAHLNGDKIACLSWILRKNIPDVGQKRERNLTLCRNVICRVKYALFILLSSRNQK